MAPRVRVIACGAVDRGDDSVAHLALDHVLEASSAAVRGRLDVRHRAELDIVDLTDVPAGTTCLVLDAAVGIAPGTVFSLPLASLVHPDGTTGGPLPHSSHTLPVDLVLALATTLGRLPAGAFVGIGGSYFGLGADVSAPVAAALPAFEALIADEIAGRLETGVMDERAGRPVPRGPSNAARPSHADATVGS